MINYIKRTFDQGNDIAEKPRTLKIQNADNWMPTLKMNIAEDQELVKRENRQFKLEYKAKLDEAIKRADTYQQNMYMAYKFLWEKCSCAMQNKIVGQSDFNTKIYNNPIKLLIATKEHSLNFQDSRYKMAIIVDAIKVFMNTRQKDNESLQEYTQRFKSAKDIMELHIRGMIIFRKYIELSTDYKEHLKQYENKSQNETEKTNLNEEKYFRIVSSKLYDHIYLNNTNKSKYESILKI